MPESSVAGFVVLRGYERMLRVLLIEDSPVDAELVKSAFKSSTISTDLTHVSTLAAALQFLHTAETDVAILDLGLPDGAGIQNLWELKAEFPDLVVVIRTAWEESLNEKLLRGGAAAFVSKPNEPVEGIVDVAVGVVERDKEGIAPMSGATTVGPELRGILRNLDQLRTEPLTRRQQEAAECIRCLAATALRTLGIQDHSPHDSADSADPD